MAVAALPAALPASAAASTINDSANGAELTAAYAAFADAISLAPEGGTAGSAGSVLVELELPSALAVVREHGVRVCVWMIRSSVSL